VQAFELIRVSGPVVEFFLSSPVHRVLVLRRDRASVLRRRIPGGIVGFLVVQIRPPWRRRITDARENRRAGRRLVDPRQLKERWANVKTRGNEGIIGARRGASVQNDERDTQRWRPFNATLLLLACAALPVLLAYLLFRSQRLLFDAATPALGLMLLFVTLLVLTATEAMRQRRSLERVLAEQREQSARIEGELKAAQRIQTASLPRVDLLQSDARVDLAATLVPAREVGGDLYDYFMLDDHRLFFLVGDVAGKGLSASIFMAVSKALCKSAVLRMRGDDIGALVSVANEEISRDNPEMLFVTLFAGILDLDSGDLDYCNAGHENPYLLQATDPVLYRITDGDGPPLCAVAEFGYRGGHCRLKPGALLCLMTDGVTEAQNAAGELYGHARVGAVLRGRRDAVAIARGLVDALHDDVQVFAAGAEAADDLTILALRWRGAGTGG
jgi:adenylate cyclase